MSDPVTPDDPPPRGPAPWALVLVAVSVCLLACAGLNLLGQRLERAIESTRVPASEGGPG